MYVGMKSLLEKAQEEQYAVMAINCFNFETIQTVIEAAEEENAPIIINIFHEHLSDHLGTKMAVAITRTLAEEASVPVALNYDHGTDFRLVEQALEDGFSSIMVDASKFELEKNIEITRQLTKKAHAMDVSVEAELGSIGDDEQQTSTDEMTDPIEAAQFVEKTEVDCLAVSYGSSHGDYPKGVYPDLDFTRLSEIKSRVSVPLVLHGGSGLGEENIRKSIQMGVSKINVGNDFMKANTQAISKALEDGKNYYESVRIAGEESKSILKYYIQLSGSKNKA